MSEPDGTALWRPAPEQVDALARQLPPARREGDREQPDPVPNSTRPLWEQVVEDMQARDAVGRERYGTPLQVGNGRDALRDAYAEELDKIVYLKQAILEWDALHAALEKIAALPCQRGMDGIHSSDCCGRCLAKACLPAAEALRAGEGERGERDGS